MSADVENPQDQQTELTAAAIAAEPATGASTPTPKVNVSEIDGAKPKGPSFFGYKPPKWAHDFDYIRMNKGKGKPSDSKTWLLHTVDRLLKMHSI